MRKEDLGMWTLLSSPAVITFITLLILKLKKVINIKWLWVTSPLWLVTCYVLGLTLIALLIEIIENIFKNKNRERNIKVEQSVEEQEKTEGDIYWENLEESHKAVFEDVSTGKLKEVSIEELKLYQEMMLKILENHKKRKTTLAKLEEETKEMAKVIDKELKQREQNNE